VHFLGYPELMSNRSTSTDLFEFINASTNKERNIWTGFYEELFYKALVMAQKFQTGYDPDKNAVKAQILDVTDAKIQELATVWLPLYNAGVVPLTYMLSKIPDIDVDEAVAESEKSAMRMYESIRRQEEETGEDDAE